MTPLPDPETPAPESETPAPEAAEPETEIHPGPEPPAEGEGQAPSEGRSDIEEWDPFAEDTGAHEVSEPPADFSDLELDRETGIAPAEPETGEQEPPASAADPVEGTPEALDEEPGDPQPEPPAQEGEQKSGDDDVLEETPEFLQDSPEHDRLWFDQQPPKDFDFND